MKSDVIVNAIKDVLQANGFKRKGSDWWIESDECICIFNVQHPHFSDKFHLNLAVHPKVLDPALQLRYYDCPLNIRLQMVSPNEHWLDEIEVPNAHMWNQLDPNPHEHTLDRCLSFLDGNEEQTKHRLRILRHYVETFAIPFLLRCRTLKGLNDAISEYHLQPYAMGSLKQLLHIRV